MFVRVIRFLRDFLRYCTRIDCVIWRLRLIGWLRLLAQKWPWLLLCLDNSVRIFLLHLFLWRALLLLLIQTLSRLWGKQFLFIAFRRFLICIVLFVFVLLIFIFFTILGVDCFGKIILFIVRILFFFFSLILWFLCCILIVRGFLILVLVFWLDHCVIIGLFHLASLLPLFRILWSRTEEAIDIDDIL